MQQHAELLKKVLKFVNKRETYDMPSLIDFVKFISDYYKKKEEKVEKSKVENLARTLFDSIGRKWQERRSKDFAEDWLLGVGKFEEDAEIKQKLKQNKKDSKSVEEVFQEFKNKEDDIQLNGDDAMKKEYLEETDEATEKLEDKQEAEPDDDITVESVDSEENEIEIEGIESDYAESVASDNEEPNTDEVEPNTEEEMDPQCSSSNGRLDNPYDDKPIEIQDGDSLSDHSTKSDSEKENCSLSTVRKAYETALEKYVTENAKKHVKNLPETIKYINSKIEEAQKYSSEEVICTIIENVTTQLMTEVSSDWKSNVKNLASELKAVKPKKRASSESQPMVNKLAKVDTISNKREASEKPSSEVKPKVPKIEPKEQSKTIPDMFKMSPKPKIQKVLNQEPITIDSD